MAADRDRLLEIRPADGEPILDAEVPELGRAPAGPESDDQAAFGQLVDGRELLREDDRVPHRDDDHAGPDADGPEPTRNPCQKREHLVDAAVVLGVARVDEEVVGAPDVAEPVSFGSGHRGFDAGSRSVVADRRQDEAIVHRRHPSGA